MKHKIAVYGNGWNLEALQHALVGIRKYASLEDFDVYVFLSYASYSVYSGINQGQLNIYELCDITSFDGIIVFSTLLNSPSTAVDLCHRAKELGIPVVSVGMEIEGIPTILVQNRDGMADLVTHLAEEHNIKRVIFMGGTPDHVDSQERLAVTKEILEKRIRNIIKELERIDTDQPDLAIFIVRIQDVYDLTCRTDQPGRDLFAIIDPGFDRLFLVGHQHV